ncbi:MAG TPA: hypothetical protein VHL80_11290 [Polyangia bacterium]|nr:hypothetical protein [Polyangia bacterium]
MSLAPASPQPARPGPAAAPGPRPASLDDLAAEGPEALAALYAGARTPVLADMDGPLVGRMLAVPALPRFLAGFLRWFAARGGFPWRGKTFTHKEGGRGQGINRVFGDRRPRHWFRFDTFVAPSRAGAFDAVQLDYDNPGNPGFIRAIKDEVREVAPGLYLGLAYFVLRGRARLVLYFGLQRR